MVMSEISAIAAATGALNSAVQIAKTALALRDETKLREAVIELQGIILTAQANALTAQTRQLELVEQKRDLETKVAEYDRWERERTRYELLDMPPGVLAYRVKEDARGKEPSHLLCATCFENRRKSYLHVIGEKSRGYDYLHCQFCNTKLERRHGDYARRSIPRASYGDDDFMS
jgi:hypothetical protein